MPPALSPLTVFYGNAPLLVLEAADAFRGTARAQGFSQREVLTALSGFDWGELRAAATSGSLFGDKTLIDLRIPSGKPGKTGAAALAEVCPLLGEQTVMLITLPELDWKEEKAAWFTALTSFGPVRKLNEPPRAELPGWLAGRLKQQGQEAPRAALQFIAEHVEGNLLAAHQEIQKLGLLYPPGMLKEEDIRAAVLNVARYDIDDLRQALLQGDLARFARTLEGLRQEGESPVLALWAVTEEVRALARLKGALARRIDPARACQELRLHGPRQSQIRAAERRLSAAALKTALDTCARLDRAIKGLAQQDVWNGFLRLGIELWAKPRRP
ncbi:MAG: DNA polymerase III subunit delta [Zoogloeaceae bacterium]|jgi:DNA polymerase-3 subunit delta|nr:DNA polymerase III subunit delta [Zoogloeaceae bacterium]